MIGSHGAADERSCATEGELSPNLVDGLNGQAAAMAGRGAAFFGMTMTSIPLANFTPSISFG